MNNTNTLSQNFDRRHDMVEQIMQLHRCADCPIRCQAVKKPHSFFARIHRWHRTWWPGWKIYLRELRAGNA
jgi:hypothetical protein